MTNQIEGPDDTTATAAVAVDDAQGRAPHWVPGLLIVLATVIAVVSALSTWVKTQALDTDAWVEASSELLEKPEVRDALSVYLVDELYASVDVDAELASVLPDGLSALAGPLAGALRGGAESAMDDVLASPKVAELWAAANRVAHEALVAIIRDDTGAAVSTTGGEVTLHLAPMVKAIGERVGLPESLIDRIPPDAGTVTVLKSETLANVQTTVRILDFLSWFLFLLVVVLYALAVYLAFGRRREMLGGVGYGLLSGGVVLLLLQALGVRTGVDALVNDATNRPVAEVVGEVATQLLRQMAWSGIIYGVVIVVFAALLGDHAWAVSARRALGRWSPSDVAVVVTTVLIVLVLVWWSPGHAFDRWVTTLTLIGLVVAAVVTLVMQTRREYPAGSLDTPEST